MSGRQHVQNHDLDPLGETAGVGIIAAVMAENSAIVTLTGPDTLFDFVSVGEPLVHLHDLDAAGVRSFAVAVERARCEGRSSRLTFGDQSMDIMASDTSITFRQGKRRLEVSPDVASEVERRCHSAANNMS